MAHAETSRGPAWSRPSDPCDGHTPPSPAPSPQRTLRAMELEGDTIQGEQEQEDWSEGEAAEEAGGAAAVGEAEAELAALRLEAARRVERDAAQREAEYALLRPFVARRLLESAGWDFGRVERHVRERRLTEPPAFDVLFAGGYFSISRDDEDVAAGWCEWVDEEAGAHVSWVDVRGRARVEDGVVTYSAWRGVLAGADAARLRRCARRGGEQVGPRARGAGWCG